MKLILFVFITIFYVNAVCAQSKASKEIVLVKSWKEKLFLIGEKFWQDKRDTINAQMGVGAFERVKKYADHRNVPSAFLPFDGKKATTLEELSERLSRLKNLRKVAVFPHTRNGIDYGNQVVLEVPYKGNEKWQTGVKWDTVYFILPEKDVEIIKDNNSRQKSLNKN